MAITNAAFTVTHLSAVADGVPVRWRGRDVHSGPLLVELDEARVRGGARLLTALVDALGLFLPHMGMRQVFRSSLPPPPPARDWFGRVVQRLADRSVASTTIRAG